MSKLYPPTVLLMLAAGFALAGELKSGPQVGATLPGAFEPLNINGADAGDEACLFCKYGNAPVVMIFAAKPTPGLAKLVAEVEKAADAANKTGEVGGCVVVTDTAAPTKTALGKLADDAKLKHVVLAVIDPAKVKGYELNPDAEATVLLYSKKVVRVNRSFKPGELTDKAVAELTTEIGKHYAAK